MTVTNGLLIASLLCAAGYFLRLGSAPSFLRSSFKTMSIAALGVIAVISDAPLLLVLALGFSAVGDLALSREGERAFMIGLGAFLLAHIFYVPLLVSVGEGFSGWRWAALFGAVTYAVVVARWLWPHLGPMRIPVAVYMTAIVAMGAAAIMPPFRMVAGLTPKKAGLQSTRSASLPTSTEPTSWPMPWVMAELMVYLAM